MLEVSDWVWLAVVVLWVVLRAIPRFVRALSKRDAATAPPPATPPPRTGFRGDEPERLGDIGPGPIEPR